MPDMTILHALSANRNILGDEYWIAWNCLLNVAEVYKNGRVIHSSPFEIEAHKYLNALEQLNLIEDKTEWQRITEQQDEPETNG